MRDNVHVSNKRANRTSDSTKVNRQARALLVLLAVGIIAGIMTLFVGTDIIRRVVYFDRESMVPGIPSLPTPPPDKPPLIMSELLKPISTISRERLASRYTLFKQELWGVMDVYGKIAIPARYQEIEMVGDTILTRYNNKHWIYVGRQAINSTTNRIHLIADRYVATEWGIHRIDNLYQYIEIQGTRAMQVVGGYYLVQDVETMLWGIAQENIIIAPQFDWITTFVDGIALALIDDTWYAITETSNIYDYTNRISREHKLYDTIRKIELPQIENFAITGTASGLIVYRHWSGTLLLYCPTKQQYDTLDWAREVLDDRPFGDWIITSYQDVVNFNNIAGERIRTFDSVEPIVGDDKIYFIINRDSRYYLLDIELNVLIESVDLLLFDHNLLVGIEGYYQVFAWA